MGTRTSNWFVGCWEKGLTTLLTSSVCLVSLKTDGSPLPVLDHTACKMAILRQISCHLDREHVIEDQVQEFATNISADVSFRIVEVWPWFQSATLPCKRSRNRCCQASRPAIELENCVNKAVHCFRQEHKQPATGTSLPHGSAGADFGTLKNNDNIVLSKCSCQVLQRNRHRISQR